MAQELRASGQARRPGAWSSIRPEALVPAERDLGTGKVMTQPDGPNQHSKDRHDERHDPHGRHTGRHQAGPRRRRTGKRVRGLVIGVSAGVLILAGGGVAFARNRQQPPHPQALASLPAGGTATSPASSPGTGTPSPTPAPTSVVPAAPAVYSGTMVTRVFAFEGTPGSVRQFRGDARISCHAGACSVAIPGTPWLLLGKPISAGDGSPGTYRTSHPAGSKAARCNSFRIMDTFQSTLTISARTVTYRASAPGWPMTQCSSTHSVGRAHVTWSFTGTRIR